MNSAESSRKNKWIAGGAILAILLAGASLGRTVYLQRQASPNNLEAQAAVINARLALSSEEQARRLQLVTRLRETWKPWAKAHRMELRRMLNALPNNTSIRDEVNSAIPLTPFLSKGDNTLYQALNVHGNGEKGEIFTWNSISRNRIGKALNSATTDAQDRFRREAANYRWNLSNNFIDKRDIIISQSTQTGKVSVSLWASGRVTQDTVEDELTTTPEGMSVFTYKRQDVLPPYEFIGIKK